MNKQEKIIVAILAALAAAVTWRGCRNGEKQAQAQAAAQQQQQPAAAQQQQQPAAAQQQQPAAPAAQAQKPAADAVPAELPVAIVLSNGVSRVSVSSRGACIVGVELPEYLEKPGAQGPDNPPVKLDFSKSPALVLQSLPGVDPFAEYSLRESPDGATAVFVSADGRVERKISLDSGYGVTLEEKFSGVDGAPHSISIGMMRGDGTPDGMATFDAMPAGGKTVHYASDSVESPAGAELKRALGTSSSGGCGCGCSAAKPDPSAATQPISGAHEWVAMKSRFFVAAACGGEGVAPNAGFFPHVSHVSTNGASAVESVSAGVMYDSLPAERKTAYYFGPRRQSDLWDRGMRDVMDFGWCRWICYPLVWLLNFLNSVFGNYGVAIIVLTVLVRLVFWPLTHKSTVSMRKMQELQPLLKEIQARCKDNPQKLQMETMALYREKGVNPFASCLPMLVQIPFFIALFYVLRSGVELRYAPFLWIDDLSAPEHLLPGVFPFGGLNILPLLMAATMLVQSKLSPSPGGAQAAQQQKMMTYFMPAMMLIMFYNFASALSLYWTLSQTMGIAQTLYIRKKYAPQTPASAAVVDVDVPMTRQRRRHGG